jgi:lipoprotein-anchoring transpeptidase ErfK/SrfK
VRKPREHDLSFAVIPHLSPLTRRDGVFQHSAKTALIFLVLLVACGARFAPLGAIADGQSGRPHDALFHGIARVPWDAAALSLPLSAPRILVNKAQRKLFLYSGDKLVRTYSIGLGLSPVGDKVRQGDRRTPEGDFYIFTKNDKSAFYLSVGISYPNAPHADRGLRDGLITKAQYNTIMQALDSHKTPTQNTRLGGDIYIHGNGAGSDWTWGCVALENDDIRELFNSVNVGTPVTIKP